MKLLLLVFVFLVPLLSFSQEDTIIVDFPDVEASFPGGTAEMLSYILSNVEYPEAEFEEPPGKIYLSFIVEKDGSITSVRTERSSGSTTLDEHFESVFLEMPKWKPAELNGRVVRSRCRLPVIIHYY